MTMRVLYYMFCGLVITFLVIPVLIVIPISFSASPYLEFPPSGYSLRWYREFFDVRSWYTSMGTSLKVGAITMVVTAVLGTASALGLSYAGRHKSKWIDAILISPMIVPHIVIAIAIYAWYSKLQLIGTTLGLVAIYTAFALPFMSVTVLASLQQFDRNLEDAAMNLGSSRLQAFLRVTLPSILPGILAGSLFSFVIAFDELVVALFVSGSDTVTLPKRMWDGLRTEINPTIAAASTILIVTSFLVFAVAELLNRRYRAYSTKKH